MTGAGLAEPFPNAGSDQYLPVAERRSFSFDQRLSTYVPLTAVAKALFWPTSTTNLLPRVIPA